MRGNLPGRVDNMKKSLEHYEENAFIQASAERVFAYADNFYNFSSHMNKSTWMMGGGEMETTVDAGNGQKVGSHIQMDGKVFGVNLFLDEVVEIHEPPKRKEWKTVGKINLLVIDHYVLGFYIESQDNTSKLTIYIDYELPKSLKTRWLGYVFGEMYAKWCVQQMINGVKEHFNNKKGGE